MLTKRAVLAGLAATSFAVVGRLHASAVLDMPGLDAFQGKNQYLPWYRALQAKTDENSIDALSQLLAMMGDEDGAFRIGRKIRSRHAPNLTGFSARDAIEAIAEAAKDRQIVILNEAHNISRCRAFALDVALKLREQGFEIFTAETLSPYPNDAAAQSLNADGWITTNIGWYVRDPVYAELLRGAERAGFRFATYEMRNDQRPATGVGAEEQVAAREEAEANNFITNVLAANPKARVFVYCGYGHLIKLPFGPEKHAIPFFGARLKQKTGIDPLCIVQDAGAPPPDPTLEPDFLRAILDHFQPEKPIVVTDTKGQPFGNGPLGGFDMAVYHPRLPYVGGRPGWLARAAGRKTLRYRLPKAAKGYSLLQAVPAREAEAHNAVPSDQFPITAGVREANFLLRPGAYQIRLETDAGRHVLGPIKL